MTDSAEPLDRTRFVLIGAGRVGTAVASVLQAAGHQPVGIISRSPSSARRAAARLGASVFEQLDDIPPADLVLLGVGESAIDDVAGKLALHVVPGVVVVHFAGALGLAPLRPLFGMGARGAALHPVQAMPTIDVAIARLRGSAWGVTCPPDLRDWAHTLIQRDLDGVPFDVREEDRPLWHAASVTTSNGIAGLMSAGERMLSSIAISEPERVLGPLAAGTVTNAIEGGGGSATLTGPAIRGERATIERHLEILRTRAPELLEPYRLATMLVVDGALAGGRMSADDARAVHSLLRDDP